MPICTVQKEILSLRPLMQITNQLKNFKHGNKNQITTTLVTKTTHFTKL